MKATTARVNKRKNSTRERIKKKEMRHKKGEKSLGK